METKNTAPHPNSLSEKGIEKTHLKEMDLTSNNKQQKIMRWSIGGQGEDLKHSYESKQLR
jgi:hypothetical protein